MDYLKEVEGWNDDKIKVFCRLPDWKIRRIGNIAVVWSRGYVYSPTVIQKYHEIANELLEIASKLEEKRVEAIKEKPKLPSIQERTKTKVQETIYTSWDDEVIEEWLDGNFKVKFDCLVLKDAYENKCDQAKEAYSHIKKGDKKKMLNVYDNVFSDLDKLKDSFKATRKARVRAPRTNEQQVLSLIHI